MDESNDGLRPSRNGHGPDAPLPRTDRPDAPAYLRRYLERRSRGPEAEGDLAGTGAPAESSEGNGLAGDEGLPLYLRRFRARKASGEPAVPLATPLAGERATTWTEPWAATSRSNDLVLPPEYRPGRDGEGAVVDVHLMRHGETQGYSVSAGLTPMGRWQAQRRGHDLSKGIRDGESVRVICAPTARATQTAEQLRRGIDDGLALWGRTADVSGPVPADEFANFGVWTPSGERDITAAFREYHAVAERYERVALGDRPLWLVEIDRFFRVQMGGGDAIHFWMTVPLACFEPPTAVVLRLWAGITRLVAEAPDAARLIVAAHSGPIRALATWALGHDAGEPYNVEEVRIKVRRSLDEAQVTYRNRTAEIHVPAMADPPTWWANRAARAVGAGAAEMAVAVPMAAPPPDPAAERAFR